MLTGESHDDVDVQEKIYIAPEGTHVNLEQIARLHIIRCTNVASRAGDWHHINIFFTYIKIGDNLFKNIIDGGSCTNLVAKSVIDCMGLKVKHHPQTYSVTWVDENLHVVIYRSLVSIHFSSYHEQV